MSENKDNNYLYVPEQYIKDLEEKAKDAEYFKGRVDGMEYVIDSFENAFKGKEE